MGPKGTDDNEEERPCFGSCLAGLVNFVGEASARPDRDEPEGGWGYTACCKTPAHFDCLGRWLKPEDVETGTTLVDSTSGPVPMALRCPFCKHALSHSSTRMMRVP